MTFRPIPDVDDFIPRAAPPRSLADFATRYRLDPAAVLRLFEDNPMLAGEIDGTGRLSGGAWIIAARHAPPEVARAIAATELVAFGNDVARIGRSISDLIAADPERHLVGLVERGFGSVALVVTMLMQLCAIGGGQGAEDFLASLTEPVDTVVRGIFPGSEK